MCWYAFIWDWIHNFHNSQLTQHMETIDLEFSAVVPEPWLICNIIGRSFNVIYDVPDY